MKLHVESAQKDRRARIDFFKKTRQLCIAKCTSALDTPRSSTVRRILFEHKKIIELQNRFKGSCSLDGIIAAVDSISANEGAMSLQQDLNDCIIPCKTMSREVLSERILLAIRSRSQSLAYQRSMCRHVQNHGSKSQREGHAQNRQFRDRGSRIRKE
jgi:hypothetical protein